MLGFEELLSNEEIRKEYEKAVLLTMFKKICSRMDKSEDYSRHINKLYRETFDAVKTTQRLFRDEFTFDLDEQQSFLVNSWMIARLNKSDCRKPIADSVKKSLYKQQNGICAACGESLGDNWKMIHVDHIIPWKLVGDELPNNFQLLCSTCNECKGANTDYIFKQLIHLN